MKGRLSGALENDGGSFAVAIAGKSYSGRFAFITAKVGSSALSLLNGNGPKNGTD